MKKEAKPDLGNTRINGISEGLTRGSKLTGRISRAVSIGEDVMRQNGAAFDSHTRKNAAGDTYFCPDCRAWMSDATVGVHDRRNPTHSSQVRDASGNLKGAHWAKEERANAGDRPAGAIYKSLGEIKKQIAMCKEDLAMYEKSGKDREAKAMRADIKGLEADYAHDAPLWEKHNAGDSAKAIIVQRGGGAAGWIIADSEGRRLYGPFPSYSAAEADFKRRNLEMANAGDEGFLRQSGMGLAPAPEPGDELEEPQPIMANARAAVRVKRGAAKYGSRDNASSPRFKVGDKIKAHGEKAKVVGVNDQNKYGGKDHSYEVEKSDGVREVWWEDEVSPGIF